MRDNSDDQRRQRVIRSLENAYKQRQVWRGYSCVRTHGEDELSNYSLWLEGLGAFAGFHTLQRYALSPGFYCLEECLAPGCRGYWLVLCRAVSVDIRSLVAPPGVDDGLIGKN